MLRVDEKNLREHNVFNVCGVVMTTNHKTDGIYLPADDRRHYVAWSEATKDDFDRSLLERASGAGTKSGGFGHVAAYLAELDLSGFNPKAPPPKTPAFWAIVDANRAPEDAELADVLDELGNPDAVTLAMLAREGERRDLRLATRPQEPARHPAPARTMRLRPGAQRRRRRRPTTAFSRSRSGDRWSMEGPTFP